MTVEVVVVSTEVEVTVDSTEVLEIVELGPIGPTGPAGLTATPVEVKVAYESNADTNAFTDAEKAKLAAPLVEADITDLDKYTQLEVDTKLTAANLYSDDSDALQDIAIGDNSQAVGTVTTDFNNHAADLANPHVVTTTQIGAALLVHTHIETDITDLDKYTQLEVDNAISTRAPLAHAHSETDIYNLDKYTQLEVTGFLATKAPVVHAHLESDITDLDKYSQSESDNLLATKAPLVHAHVELDITDLDKYTQLEVTNLDDAVLAAAKVYADDITGSEITKTYVDDGDDAVLVAAKLYADDVTGSEISKTYVDGGDATSLSSANLYTDNGLLLKAALVHTHVETDITDLDKYTQLEVTNLIGTTAPLVHAHVELDITDLDKYTQLETNNLLDTKAPVVHTHLEADVTDLDKYTQLETDNLLDTKAPVIHAHVETDITDLDKYTQLEVTNLLATKAAVVHAHVETDITDLDKYTQLEVDDALGLKIDVSQRGANGGVAELDATGKVVKAQLASGTPSIATFLRGDNIWASPSTGGGLGAIPLLRADGTPDNINITALIELISITVTNQLNLGANADVFIESEYGWSDLKSPIQAGTGINEPKLGIFRDGLELPKFNSGKSDEFHCQFHVNHDYAPGTNLYPHIHFTVNTTDSGVVRWLVEYSVAAGHQQAGTKSIFAASTTVVLEQTIVGATDQYKHFVLEVPDIDAINSTKIEPDSVVLMKITRDGPHVNDTYPTGVYGITVDIHQQVGRFSTKNKSPDFYN